MEMRESNNRENMEEFIQQEVKKAMRDSQGELLDGIKTLISSEVSKVNENQKHYAEMSLSKISAISNSDYRFKRRSNEEQFKLNGKIIEKIKQGERNIEFEFLEEAKENLQEATELLKQRQKLIRIADESELGWKVIDEYVKSEVASDEEDQKRIYRAQARANTKVKAERAKKRRFTPYGRPKTQSEGVRGQVAQRRPGLCFACGAEGHWKNECPKMRQSANKISDNSFIFIRNKMYTGYAKDDMPVGKLNTYEIGKQVDNKSGNRTDSMSSSSIDTGKSKNSMCDESHILEEQQQVSSKKGQNSSPVNRLSEHIDMWKQAGADEYILGVVENGYRIPFKEIPNKQCERNNKSARDNGEFVEEEISKLLDKGCICETADKPAVINPLTVAFNKKGKPRLVLDCRCINKYLVTFKYKYEDIKTARAMFEKGTYMFTFDIRSAYHHISIFQEHRHFLGFAWGNKYYVFNVLPFGLATAGHIFSKVLRVLIKYWRSKGYKIITFLDDGIGGDKYFESALNKSLYIKESIVKFGFLLAEEKCEWIPKLQASWLGYFINMSEGRFFIVENRIQRIERSIDSMIDQLLKQKYSIMAVRYVAAVTGQIISTQMVLGNIVRLKTGSYTNVLTVELLGTVWYISLNRQCKNYVFG